jgi:hypothetical protein
VDKKKVKHKGRNSLEANNEIWQHYGDEKLVQILKRQNRNGKIKIKENCVWLREGGRLLISFFGESRRLFTFRTEAAVDFQFFRRFLLFKDFSVPNKNCNFDVLLPVFLPASGGL